MAFTSIKSTQVAFLEKHLRGTNRTLTESQAKSLYGVKNLRARLSDMRQAGLNVTRVSTKTTSRSAYRISRRDVFGDQFKIFN